MLSASAGIGSRKNICHKTQTAGQAFTACPAAFSARIESVFFVYGGAAFELSPNQNMLLDLVPKHVAIIDKN